MEPLPSPPSPPPPPSDLSPPSLSSLSLSSPPSPPSPTSKLSPTKLSLVTLLQQASESGNARALAHLCGGEPFLTTDPSPFVDARSCPPFLFNSLTAFFNTFQPTSTDCTTLCVDIVTRLLAVRSPEDLGAPLNFMHPLSSDQQSNITKRFTLLQTSLTALQHTAEMTLPIHLEGYTTPAPPIDTFLTNLVNAEFTAASQTVASSERLLANVNNAMPRNKGFKCQIYGSSLAELQTRGSDVDVSIFIPFLERARREYKAEAGGMAKRQFEKMQKDAVYDVKRALERARFKDVRAVPFARIPVVKSVDPKAQNPFHPAGEMHADICFFNDIAVRNSHLMREYAMYDRRARMLMMLVKLWIKAKKIGSAQFGTPSSYCWMNLAVFYLQVRKERARASQSSVSRAL